MIEKSTIGFEHKFGKYINNEIINQELKLCEHELWHYIMKEKGWLKFYSNCIQAKYINYKPKEYLEMRNRLYTVYRKKLQKICKIENWIKMER